MENINYLFAGYTVIWIFITGYLFYLGNIQNKIMKEIKRIEQTIKKA